jgi:hypothetical protein
MSSPWRQLGTPSQPQRSRSGKRSPGPEKPSETPSVSLSRRVSHGKPSSILHHLRICGEMDKFNVQTIEFLDVFSMCHIVPNDVCSLVATSFNHIACVFTKAMFEHKLLHPCSFNCQQNRICTKKQKNSANCQPDVAKKQPRCWRFHQSKTNINGDMQQRFIEKM